MAVLFISYAHEDEDWRRLVENHLKVLELNRVASLDVWSDKKLQAGSEWKATIEAKLEGASVAVLIVTPSFLSSEFIMREELPCLIYRKKANQKLTIIPVLASPCAYEYVPELSGLQFWTAGGLPLEAVPKYEQNNVLTGLVKEVGRMLRPEGEEAPPPPPPPQPAPPILGPVLHLEVSLRHRMGDEHQAELRYTDTRNPSQNRSLVYRARIHSLPLEGPQDTPERYAAELVRRLFPEGPPRAVLDMYTDRMQEKPARLRVNIEATSLDLQRVFWETLPLALGSGSGQGSTEPAFSRTISAAGESWPSPVMSAWPDRLVNLCHLPIPGDPQVPAVVRDLETALRRESIQCRVLQDQLNLKGTVRPHSALLFLFVHLDWGTFDPVVTGQGSEGEPAACSFEDLAKRVRGLPFPPQVIVVDTADDPASKGDVAVEEILVRLASELITTGVCAVVARQAPMERSLWLVFLSRLLSGLWRTGNLDEAIQSARSAVGKSDCWKPLVMARIRTGQLWYRPNFLGDASTAWELLIRGIRHKDRLCIPILGPLVSRHVVRSRGDVAERLALKYHYPGAREERRDLRIVAQYVATTRQRRWVMEEYENAVVEYLTEQYPEAVRTLRPKPGVLEVLNAVWESMLRQEGKDPFNLLARLRLPLYLTTHLHNYLSLAISKCCEEHSSAGAGPADPMTPRNRVFAEEERILGEEEDLDDRKFSLSEDRPVVYHLFGRIDVPETMVLTDDDHIRFLLRFNGKWARLPSAVRTRISDSALLFLGFDLRGWEFRSVFRALLDLAGSDVFRDNAHVAVQVNVDDDNILDPDRAQSYLVEYFKQISKKPFVFLGSAQEFLLALTERLQEAGVP